jgi:hypothetical protein
MELKFNNLSLAKQSDYETHISKFTRREEIDAKGFSVKFQRSHMRSAGLDFSTFLGLGSKRENSVTVTLSGTSGRRVRIRRPEAFLEEVLKQDGVEQWIRTHATLKHKSKYGNHAWTAPELWLVTGVQYLTGGEYEFEDNATNELSAHGGADIGAAAGGPAGVAKLQAEARHERANGAQNGFGHEDERVWAAQFMTVKIDFGAQASDPSLSSERSWVPKTIKTIYLEDVKDLEFQGVRASREQADEETPELVARITTTAGKRDEGISEEEDSASEEEEGFVVDDGPYVIALQNANWEMYNKYNNYLAQRAAQRTRQVVN